MIRLIRRHTKRFAHTVLPPFVTGATEAADRRGRKKAGGGSSIRTERGSAITRRQIAASTALALVLTLPIAAEAGLVVSSAGSISISAGTEGFLDINVHSDSQGGDSLGTVVVSYQIDAPGLSFFVDGAGNPDEPQLTNPKYVFFGNSLAVTSGVGGSVNTTRDTYTQSDATADGTGVLVTSTDVLLATLHFVATTPGEYHINIDPASSGFFDASPDLNSIDFTVSRFGTVTVTAPTDSSIPEPAGFILAALGAFGLVGVSRWRGGIRDQTVETT